MRSIAEPQLKAVSAPKTAEMAPSPVAPISIPRSPAVRIRARADARSAGLDTLAAVVMGSDPHRAVDIAPRPIITAVVSKESA